MNSSIRNSKPDGVVLPSDEVSKTEGQSTAGRKPRGPFALAAWLAGLVCLLTVTPAAHADRSPPGCLGSGLGISLFTSLPDVHIGDTISYTVNVFNAPFPACDAGWVNPAIAGAIRAYVITPDGVTNNLTLRRTYLAPGESDVYTNVVSYVVRAQDIRPDGTLRAVAVDQGDIHQNDVNSTGGGNQGVNTQVNQPAVLIAAQCVPSVGENGAIAFTGTVTNSGNTTLVGVTVTNFYDAGSYTVLFPTNLAIGQVASFSGTWIPANPCLPSTATLTVMGTDQFTSTPRTVTSFTTITCQNTLTPGIKVTKVCPEQPVAPGQLLTFSGTVSNTGNVTLTDIVVVNSQPAPNTPVFTQASLVPGEVANFTGSYLAPTNCSVADTLTATATSRCGTAVTDTVSATCPILTTPQIAVTAVCPANPIVPGSVLTYSGTVRNTGNITLTNVVVVSDRPAANTTVFTVATLAPGASAPYTASYTVPASDCSVVTTVVATGKDICTGSPASNSAVATCTVATAPAIAVTLACPTVPAATGGQITYTGTVRNSGNVILNNVTVVNDQAVPNTVLSVPSLAPGASANFTASFTAPADACSVSSTVTATGSDACAATVVTATQSATCPLVTAPSIVLTQNCPEGPVSPGGLLTYSGTVKNAGNITLTNIVVTNDRTGATPVFTTATLAPGASANFTGSFLTQTNCSTTSTSTATATSLCGAAVTDKVSTTCPILTTPQIAVTADCPATPIVPGSVLNYSGTVRNTGNITLTNVVVVSDRPAANTTVFTVATLAPGASAPYTASYTVPASDCSVVTTVVATGKDICTGSPASNSAVATCTVATAPAIAVTLACPTVPAATGGQITYTGTVRNSGNVILNNVTVVNDQAVPNTVLSVPSLAPGASANFTASFTAPADACSVSSTVTATGSDACAATVVTATQSATCPLVTAPSIVLTQNCPEGPVSPGGLLTYSGTVKNAGNITLTNIVVTNDRTGATPVFTTATLAPGASANFTGSFLTQTNCSTTSTSTATATSLCGAAVTDKVSTTCPILTTPQIAVTADCPATPIVPGSVLNYSGTVRNTGNITLTNVVVVSDRPAANTTVFTVATLAPGASAPYTASYTVPATDCSVVTTVVATGKDICTGSPASNSAVATCTVATAPAIAVTLACPTVPAATGGQITYTGTVRNSGNVILNNVTVVNDQAVPNTVLSVPSLAPGASANFTASFTAPADACSVSSTVTATGSDACAATVVTATQSATCPLVTAPGIAITQNCPVDPLTPGGDVTYTGSVRNSGNVTLTNIVVTSGGGNGLPTTNTVDTIWVDDAVPAGSLLTSYGGDTWTWVSSNPTPFSGTKAHQSIIGAGFHQHVFKYATVPFPIGVGDILFGYVYLDPANVPSEVMLEWNDGNFEHRAYWGANKINLGTDGTASRRYLGPLPAAGQWVRLEVPAKLVAVEGRPLNGMAFSVYGGRATWDAAGKTSQTVTPGQPGGEVVFTAATLAPGASADFAYNYTVPATGGCSFTSTLTAKAADKCTGSPVTANVSTTCPLVTAPAIVVTQVCPTTPVLQGGILTYSGTVRNAGNITLSNIVVVNNRPADHTVIFTAASLAPGTTANFTGSYEVPLNCCVVWSTVTASGRDTCTGAEVTDTDTATCTVLTSPKIVITKECPTKPVEPGDVLEYSGTVSNTGNIALIDVTIVNTQPNAGTPVLGPITLGPGESVGYTASYTVPVDFCGTDTVTAQGLDACTFAPVVNSVTTTCPVITAPRIAVTKNCPSETTPRGGVFTFTGTVSNPGNVTLTNVTVVNDYQADCYSRTNGLVIGPITLAPGASVNFSGSYTAPMSCCEVFDILTASGQDLCSGTRVAATASQVCPLLSTPSIAVTRVCPATPVPAGGLYVFTGTVSNTGDVNLTNVYVVSSQPSPNTPVLGPIELAPGEKKTFSGSYSVTEDSDPEADTVTASGLDICQGRTVTATADCYGPIGGSLAITSVTVADGMATITWAATPGATYRVQCGSKARNAVWIDVPGDVTASGPTASKSEAVGSNTQRFYRVMLVQ